MMRRFWAYTGDTGFDTYETAEAARQACDDAIAWYREDAPTEGWAEEVESICWGTITEVATRTNEYEHHELCTPDDLCHPDCDVEDPSVSSICDYAMQDIDDEDDDDDVTAPVQAPIDDPYRCPHCGAQRNSPTAACDVCTYVPEVG